MLWEEAEWVGRTILKYIHPGENLLNIGSSSLKVRTISQPYVEKFIFGPLRDKHSKVTHTDIQNVEGVDIVGDLTDPGFVQNLKQLNFDMVICCNLMEHLSNRGPIVESMNEIVPSNGYFLITVPFHYPHHLDPIDTMYRPSLVELQKEFPQFQLIEGVELTARRSVMLNDKIGFSKELFSTVKRITWFIFQVINPKLLSFL